MPARLRRHRARRRSSRQLSSFVMALGARADAVVGDVVHLAAEGIDGEHGVALCLRHQPHGEIEGAAARLLLHGLGGGDARYRLRWLMSVALSVEAHQRKGRQAFQEQGRHIRLASDAHARTADRGSSACVFRSSARVWMRSTSSASRPSRICRAKGRDVSSKLGVRARQSGDHAAQRGIGACPRPGQRRHAGAGSSRSSGI